MIQSFIDIIETLNIRPSGSILMTLAEFAKCIRSAFAFIFCWNLTKIEVQNQYSQMASPQNQLNISGSVLIRTMISESNNMRKSGVTLTFNIRLDSYSICSKRQGL